MVHTMLGTSCLLMALAVVLGEVRDNGDSCPHQHLSTNGRWCIQETKPAECATQVTYSQAVDTCTERGANVKLCPQDAVVFAQVDLCPVSSESDEEIVTPKGDNEHKVDAERMFWTSSDCAKSKQKVKAQRYFAMCDDPKNMDGEDDEKRLVLCCAEHEPAATRPSISGKDEDRSSSSRAPARNDEANRADSARTHTTHEELAIGVGPGKHIAKIAVVGLLGVGVLGCLLFSCKKCRSIIFGSSANVDDDDESMASSVSQKVFAYSLKKRLRKMFACLPCCKKQRARGRVRKSRRKGRSSSSEDIESELGRRRSGSRKKSRSRRDRDRR